jgi:N-acetylneuraminic acid mutarotase
LDGVPRFRSFGFSLNGKGYIGAGMDFGLSYAYQDLWEYNPTTNAWTQKADFGGGPTWDNATFVINQKGYVVTGGSTSAINIDDTWEYNPTTNVWTQKADFGGVARIGAVGFSIGAKGYVGTGNDLINNNGVLLQDFWEYNPITNAWIQKANFGGGLRTRAADFSIGTRGYVGLGLHYASGSGLQFYQDLWEYNPTTNVWTQKANFPGLPRRNAVSFSIGNKGYLGTGSNELMQLFQDFWEYNPITNTWIQKANYGGGNLDFATGFSIGSRGYIGTGVPSPGITTKIFYEYCP